MELLDKELIQAIQQNNISALEQLVSKKNKNINARDISGNTIWAYALNPKTQKQETLINYLLEEKADPNAQTEFGYNACYIALCYNASQKVLSQLIKQTKNLGAVDINGNSLFHVIAAYKRTDTLINITTMLTPTKPEKEWITMLLLIHKSKNNKNYLSHLTKVLLFEIIKKEMPVTFSMLKDRSLKTVLLQENNNKMTAHAVAKMKIASPLLLQVPLPINKFSFIGPECLFTGDSKKLESLLDPYNY